MKKLLLLLIIPTLAYAENKIYYSENRKLEVVDISGNKTILELNNQYNTTDLKDITQNMQLKIKEYENITIKNEEKKKLIDAKIQEMAISELIKEGKLNNTGNTTLGE